MYLQGRGASTSSRSDTTAPQLISKFSAITDLNNLLIFFNNLYIVRSPVSINYLNRWWSFVRNFTSAAWRLFLMIRPVILNFNGNFFVIDCRVMSLWRFLGIGGNRFLGIVCRIFQFTFSSCESRCDWGSWRWLGRRGLRSGCCIFLGDLEFLGRRSCWRLRCRRLFSAEKGENWIHR